MQEDEAKGYGGILKEYAVGFKDSAFFIAAFIGQVALYVLGGLMFLTYISIPVGTAMWLLQLISMQVMFAWLAVGVSGKIVFEG